MNSDSKSAHSELSDLTFQEGAFRNSGGVRLKEEWVGLGFRALTGVQEAWAGLKKVSQSPYLWMVLLRDFHLNSLQYDL